MLNRLKANLLFQLICMLVILNTLLFGAVHQAKAGDIRIVISWDPNPANENIGWYIIDWNDAGTWKLLAQDSGVLNDQGRLQYETVYPFETDYPVGTNLCFRITAAKGTDRSEPSANFCGDIAGGNVLLLTSPRNGQVRLTSQ